MDILILSGLRITYMLIAFYIGIKKTKCLISIICLTKYLDV